MAGSLGRGLVQPLRPADRVRRREPRVVRLPGHLLLDVGAGGRRAGADVDDAVAADRAAEARTDQAQRLRGPGGVAASERDAPSVFANLG